jgi:type 1 glutamine amidotransferase
MKRHRLLGKSLFSLVLICLTEACLAELPDPPPPRSRQEIEKVLARARELRPVGETEPLNVVLVADKKDHGPCEHDYPLWQKRWQALLSGSRSEQVNLYGPPPGDRRPDRDIGRVTVTTAQGWPDRQQFASADVIVVFCYIEWDEQKLAQLREYLNAGGGFVPVHSATWTKPGPSAEVARLTGCGGFTRYRHGSLKLRIVDPNHPICLGLPQQIESFDESYWPPTPELSGRAMHVLAVSNEKVAKDSPEVRPQPMFWTGEFGKGRVFGCVLGHYTWTFDDPYFRMLLLRGIAWSARQSPYRFDALVTRGVALSQ